ncbi:MAG: serine/threonine-protein kinase [Sandaracinaceae bacterium]
MDAREALERRLRDIGIADTAAVDLSATMRPVEMSATLPSTLPPSAITRPRVLPRLSVRLEPVAEEELPAGEVPKAPSDLEVIGLIGEGGMGRVLLARQHSLSRDVAVKTSVDVHSGLAAEAILAEGAITGQLEHPAIVPVHALGLDAESRPAIVMKRIEGVSWRELAQNPGHAGWEGWPGTFGDRLEGHLAILSQVCNAVWYAHSRGVVHRDIKLENVLIGRFGDVYLADWGIAARVGEGGGRLCGTLGYMAPEMVDGRPVDERTDVYLLGATLHEILTGSMRHGGDHPLAALLSAKESNPFEYPESVPAGLGELVNRACAADPEDRPASARVFRDALALFLARRESSTLAAEAAARVSRIEALDAAPESASSAGLEETITEARFGIERALRSWAENPVALEARSRLDVVLERRRKRTAELERRARDADPAVSARGRAIALVLLGLLSTTFAVLSTAAEIQVSPATLLGYPGTLFALTMIGTYLFRRSLLATSFNRGFVGALYILFSMMLVGRAVGLIRGVELADHLVRDCFVMATGLAVATFAYVRWLAVLALLFVIAPIMISLDPAHALPIYEAFTVAAIFTAAGFQWRAAMSQRRD